VSGELVNFGVNRRYGAVLCRLAGVIIFQLMRDLLLLAIHLLVTLAKILSTDHDPLFRFHRWLANLRVLEVEEIKSVPYAPLSHPFVERLIGTIRREYLDRVFFWNAMDLARKLKEYEDYYNAYRVHRSLGGTTPAQRAGASSAAPASLDRHAWRQHCRGLFQTPIAA
jgi:putative transposase